MGAYDKMGNMSRGMALCSVLVFLIGAAIGSLLPETGNVLANLLKFSAKQGHIFNPCFLVIGIFGIVLACITGYKKSR